MQPSQAIEGRNSSTLGGITSRKKTYRIKEGDASVIDAISVPLNAVYSTITWSSKDGNVVTVNERGVVRAVARGETDIIATIKNEKGAEFSMTCHVIVDDASGIDNVLNDNVKIKVWANKYQIYISGLQVGQHVNVYAATGALIYQGIANSTTLSIPVNINGVYGIKIEQFTTKILVQ